MKKIHVDKDITQAATLPSFFYTDPTLFIETKEKLFEKSWQWVGDLHSLFPPSNNVHPLSLLPPLLEEPMLLVKNQKHEIKCLSNVCTHRANILVHQSQKTKQLVCEYHGRRFDLEGRFKSMPQFEEVKNFPRPCDDLHPYDSKQWFEHLFVSIEPGFDIKKALTPMNERIGHLPIETFKRDPTRSKTYIVNSHWALYCDNYLEGFHIPFVHKDLNQQIEYEKYETHLFAYSNLQIAYSNGSSDVFDLPEDHIDYGKNISAYYFWIFPNMMFNFYPWGLSINIVSPLSKDKTKVAFYSYVYDESKLDQGAGGNLDKVEREDEFVVESVFKGIHSKHYHRGRFSPTMEKGVHHFHWLISDFINRP
jgi:choline monooxygenase